MLQCATLVDSVISGNEETDMISMTTYKDINGALRMMSNDTCLEVIRELGRTFKDGIESIDKPSAEPQSDLWSGLAAYHMLNLKGENARLDAAHKRVLKLVTDAAFDMAQDMARKEA